MMLITTNQYVVKPDVPDVPDVPSRSGNASRQTFPVPIGNGNVWTESDQPGPSESGTTRAPTKRSSVGGNRRRKPFRRSWYTARLHGENLHLARGARHVAVAFDTLDETVTVDRSKTPTVNIGDRLMLFGAGDDIALVEVAGMQSELHAIVRVLTGACADGAVQWMSAGKAKALATRRSRARGRDESLLPAVRAATGRSP